MDPYKAKQMQNPSNGYEYLFCLLMAYLITLSAAETM
jgi:hypothetical protein